MSLTTQRTSDARYNQIVGDPAEKSLSILRSNTSSLAQAFVGPLDHAVPYSDHGVRYASSLASTLRGGLSVRFATEDPTIRGALETGRMPAVTAADVDGLVARWEDALPRLRRQNCHAQATAEITDGRFQANTRALDHVEALLNNALKPLAAAFAEHPSVHCIRLDGR